MTRVLHLNWIPDPALWPGVMAKLAQQARSARELPLEFVVLTATAAGQRDGLRLVPVGGGFFAGRARRHRLIAQALPLDRYAAVIFRYHTGIDRDFSAWPAATVRVSEHHTIESEELGWARAALERWRGPRYLRQMQGIVAVTGEILRHQQRRAPGLPGMVMGNGVEVAALPVAGRRWDGGELHLGFTAGRFDSWQGLDRLLAGLAAHRGPPVVLHLAGAGVPGLPDCSAARVVDHGVLGAAEIDRLMAQVHVAVGPLAVHRKGLSEACPLKCREAVARGVPLIFAHVDPDLPDGHPGWRRLPADDSPIAIDGVVEFAGRCASDPGLTAELRAFAAARLAWESRLRQVVEFSLDLAP